MNYETQRKKALGYGAICSGIGAGVMGLFSQTNAILMDGGSLLCCAFTWGAAILAGRVVVANFFPPQNSDQVGK